MVRGARAAAVGVCTLVAIPVTFGAASASSRTAVPGSVPSWAASARSVGNADARSTLNVHVNLAVRNAAEATAIAEAVSNPRSASYGHYLTPAQYNARFAPTQAQADTVASYLRSQGLTVTDIPSNRLYVAATGTVAQVEAAFGTTLREYAQGGRTLRAPASDVTLPSGIAAVVDGVDGLAESAASPSSIAPPPGFRVAPPCSDYFGQKTATNEPPAYGRHQPWVTCGYSPQQMESAYGVAGAIASGTDGRGVTVAITDAYAQSTMRADLARYNGNHNLPSFRSGQFVQTIQGPFTNTTLCDAPGWGGEEALDLEIVHTMAPGANIHYVGAASCFDNDLLAAINYIVSGRRADIITNSWGDDTEAVSGASVRAYDHVFQAARMMGISILFSSGDFGDNVVLFGHKTVSFPATNPSVTAVGGTTLAVGQNGQRLFETGWGTDLSPLSANGTHWGPPPPPGAFTSGAGGGVSTLFPEPAYQQGVVPASLANGHRVIPDIAADADPQTGFIVGQTQVFPNGIHYGEYRIGGTSLASPLLAGIVALADQMHGGSLGFLNGRIYGLSGSSAIYDVMSPAHPVAQVRNSYVNSVNASGGVSTSLRTADHDSSLQTTPGWDQVTGVGSPNGMAFLRAMS